jgi:hypothetical protein
MAGGNFVPAVRLDAPWPADPVHVDSEAVGMQGIELVGKSADAKCGRTIS